ncbi:hypothetical protein COOONC_13625, partial [Cooperia oncophora]
MDAMVTNVGSFATAQLQMRPPYTIHLWHGVITLRETVVVPLVGRDRTVLHHVLLDDGDPAVAVNVSARMVLHAIVSLDFVTALL